MDVHEGHRQRILLDHVTFGYTPEVTVLDNVTMTFPRTGVVALRRIMMTFSTNRACASGSHPPV